MQYRKSRLLNYVIFNQFSSVTQSRLTLCDPTDCNTLGFPVHLQLLELAQTPVHWAGDVIQLSQSLSSPSPPAFNVSQHQGLFLASESVRCIRLAFMWPKYSSFSFSISPSSEYSGLISLTIDWLNLLAVQGTLKSLLKSSSHSSKASILRCSGFFMVQLSYPDMTTGKQ